MNSAIANDVMLPFFWSYIFTTTYCRMLSHLNFINKRQQLYLTISYLIAISLEIRFYRKVTDFSDYLSYYYSAGLGNISDPTQSFDYTGQAYVRNIFSIKISLKNNFMLPTSNYLFMLYKTVLKCKKHERSEGFFSESCLCLYSIGNGFPKLSIIERIFRDIQRLLILSNIRLCPGAYILSILKKKRNKKMKRSNQKFFVDYSLIF